MDFLEQDDFEFRPERARRLAILVEEFGSERGLMFTGGLASALAWEEARRAYLQGLDIATVLLTQGTVEHLLAGQLRMAGHNRRWSSSEILRMAAKERLISEEEWRLFDRLRRIRNPYVHPRAPLSEGTIEARSEDGGPYTLMEADSTLAIKALLRLLRRHPFTFE
jgi:hypothetical protein